MATPEKVPEEKTPPPYKEGEFDEHTSYSFFFFLCSGAMLFVTLWAFWDDEYARRGYKDFQEIFFQEQYARAVEEYKKVSEEISGKEVDLTRQIEAEEEKLEKSSEYQKLADAAFEAQNAYNDAVEGQKFEKSRLDEYFYYYKKAEHEGHNFEVELGKVKESEKKIAEWEPIIAEKARLRDEADAALLNFKGKKEDLEKELAKLVNDRVIVEGKMDYYKPFNLVWRPAEILQTVIPGARRNNFSEITYKVDRCQSCHIAYNDPHYENFAEPIKAHPNRDVLIGKHDPTVTGCTWCHKGQGTATAPAEDAHGSHHEMDQTLGVNEPILRGSLMQANCMNCHADVLDLKGAPVLSKGKQVFIKLGCHGCHLAEGFANLPKVGPGLFKLASKVDPSWLYRWVKNPREYLPKTRMPDFGLSDDDALKISAYLLSQSEKNYKNGAKYKGGDPAKGEKLFKSVGCQACHEVNGEGEQHAPDLTRIGTKVNPDWLVSWISNPHAYNEKSKMPDLNISESQAQHIAAFLLKDSKKQPIPGIMAKLKAPHNIEEGETLVRRRGCFACHDIHGMEKEGRIAPELSSFGVKQTRELEFGDNIHIPHNWDSWTRTKLSNPSAFRTERVLDKMPNFHLSEEEIEALMVLLKGFNGANIPQIYQRKYSKDELTIERGRRLIERYNCRGCHIVEGSGGGIQKYLNAKAQYPPPLISDHYQVGERIKGDWIYSFLKKPVPVRKWIKVKMPKFALTDQEARDLTDYFELMAPNKGGYEKGVHLAKGMDSINMGVKIVNYMDCGRCHDEGNKGIEFSIAAKRLRQAWIPGWLKDTRQMIPWTPMPDHWPKEGDGYTIPTKYRELQTVDGGNVDTAADYIRDFIVSYNNPEIDFEQNLVKPVDDEEEGGDEEEDEDEEE